MVGAPWGVPGGYPYIPTICTYGGTLIYLLFMGMGYVYIGGGGVRGGVLIYTYYICVCAYAYIHTIYVLCVYAYIHTIYVYVQRLIYTMSMLYQ